MIGKTAEETAEFGKGLSFEKVWAMFAESERKSAETERFVKELFAESERKSAETERFVKELFTESERKSAETERFVKESLAKTSMVIEELGKKVDRMYSNVGGLNRSLGELIETLIAARLWEKFPKYGLVRSYRRVPIYDDTNRMRTDIDILLSNTDKVMAVEVKRELNDKDDVNDNLKRMELIRKYPPAEMGNKELLGAMAGGVVSPDVMSYAYDSGFYVLELTGETVSLIPPPDGFKPGIW
jgi:hypothetical protein